MCVKRWQGLLYTPTSLGMHHRVRCVQHRFGTSVIRGAFSICLPLPLFIDQKSQERGSPNGEQATTKRMFKIEFWKEAWCGNGNSAKQHITIGLASKKMVFVRGHLLVIKLKGK